MKHEGLLSLKKQDYQFIEKNLDDAFDEDIYIIEFYNRRCYDYYILPCPCYYYDKIEDVEKILSYLKAINEQYHIKHINSILRSRINCLEC